MIFIVEDEAAIRDLMIYALDSAGFDAVGFQSGSELFAAMKNALPKLIMLDIMLPGESGIEILRRLRASAATAEIPVIMASAKGTEYDKVMGLNLGADDYLAKPFGMMEMVSRVRAVLRRSRPKEAALLRCGQIEMNTAEHAVFVGGEKVALTLKEYEILQLFMENAGRAFTREQLLRSVWGTDYVGETRTVDVHIGTLRSKLGPCGGCIETVRGVGYRMGAKL